MVKRTETPSLNTITSFRYAPLGHMKEIYNTPYAQNHPMTYEKDGTRTMRSQAATEKAQGHLHELAHNIQVNVSRTR